MRGNNAPKLGVRYPFKIGKSLKTNHASRDMLALTFSLIPQKATLSQPAVLTPHKDTCLVQLPTADRASSVHFSGTRRRHGDSSVHDYLLVLVDGKIWLEKASDLFYSIRPTDSHLTRPPPEYPAEPHHDSSPESWRPDSGSPITPEDDAAAMYTGHAALAPTPGTAGKSTPPPIGSRGRLVIRGGRVAPPRPPAAVSPSTATKSVGTKSVGGKSYTDTYRNGRRRPEDDDDDNNDDHASCSSSEDDDSNSDSDDSDSSDYTDESSDED
ncbi:unnamed protein product [Chondrus crispus]|uniref:Transcription elongation factor Eaf N-terminal domain-containing protein n=1 Tax=Chondrus crispus TaxID=2769 RepID=R7QUR2_CHOCR|nr:unnamed protein product [Chondrus crispus]CDF41075.1 unnamed protein product [Chondrus crispus]|eukprot:XP_005711369.1 unnamed protein product [Chondrus crispus]